MNYLRMEDKSVQPLVSVIIPAYNAEKFLAETIESAINQTYTNWEMIIVNDGSTDATEIIAKQYETKDKRIKYICQHNQGVSAARNNGFENSKGEYIAFLDADDVWIDNNLQEKVNILNNNDIYWVYSDMYFLNNGISSIASKGRNDNILKNILLWNGEVIPGPCSNIVLKRRCLDEGIKFDTKLSTAADQDFCIQLAQSFKSQYIPKTLWYYRIIENSMSRSITTMEKDHIYVYKKAKKNKLFHSFWFKKQCFSNLYLILAGSWWVNGNNKWKGLFFLVKALIYYPPNSLKILKKIMI